MTFSLKAEGGDIALAACHWDDVQRVTEVTVPSMTLAQGLARVMARPERGEVFERAWALAKETL